ncbi:cysteine desulfurase family protein [Paenisporosarcina sp. OV554]|uniref:cysteine desulfurase family protein n=1 Tax=Paenisporosarcina sp. OV554 TaxID=2135694 RepID=UPI000D375796|nr:cysteine desulfurase family protein [Paenisporosarcina sp. OV554]PUB12264.1 cysteine desulfurase [Paenisporosarcina sp. OV554]
MNRIYLDHAATSPIHPQVITKMMEAMEQTYGNPSSIHATGREARKQLDIARQQFASSIGAKDQDIILTSGGTEADNFAIFGTAYARKTEGSHIITSQIEHHAVLTACEKLEKEGFEVTYLPVNSQGRLTVEDVKQALRDDTILVTIMLGNNEVGTIQPIQEIGELLNDHKATFHTDAVQAYGLLPVSVDDLKVDLLSVSSHKINGPKGIGFLYHRKGTKLSPQFFGGQQERKRRAGTENVPGILAFAEAVTIAQQTMEEKRDQYSQFKKEMVSIWQQAEIDFKVNGEEQFTLPHILNVSFAGTDVESLLVNLDMAGLSVSSGSACTAGSINPSHVLVAMYGEKASELRNSIRFSFGYGVTDAEIKEAATITANVVKRLVK